MDSKMAVNNKTKYKEMIFLKELCRFCARKLDLSLKKDIFDTKYNHLLKAAMLCLPQTMSAGSKYPKFACNRCVLKLNVIEQFEKTGLFAAKIFDEILSGEGSRLNRPVSVKQKEPQEIENPEEDHTEIEYLDEAEDDAEYFVEPDSNVEVEDEAVVDDSPAGSKNGSSTILNSPIKCSSCSNTCTSTGKEPYQCHECEKKVPKPAKETTANAIEKATLATAARIKRLVHRKAHPCDECSKSFSSKDGLKHHKFTHTGEKPYQCDECGKSFDHPRTLSNHKALHTMEKPFLCNFCGKGLASKRLCEEHVRIHTGEKPFKCNQCEKSFRTSTTLSTHKRIHTGVRTYHCDVCQKSFVQKTHLAYHISTHSEKTHHCDECGKSYYNKAALTLHKRENHIERNRLTCHVCQKILASQRGLQQHLRIHSGEKPFKCDQCDKCFIQRISLINHKRNHTGERPFKCDQCKKTFSQPSYLSTHKRINCRTGSCKCHRCGKIFQRISRHLCPKRVEIPQPRREVMALKENTELLF